MSDDLALRMAGRQRLVDVTAVGALHSENAHRLPKVVLGLLRQYAPIALRLNLAAVTRIDAVGVAAIVLCEHETARRHAAFVIDGYSDAVAAGLRAHHAGHLLPAPSRHHTMPLRRPRTGTVCRRDAHPPRTSSRQPGGRRL